MYCVPKPRSWCIEPKNKTLPLPLFYAYFGPASVLVACESWGGTAHAGTLKRHKHCTNTPFPLKEAANNICYILLNQEFP